MITIGEGLRLPRARAKPPPRKRGPSRRGAARSQDRPQVLARKEVANGLPCGRIRRFGRRAHPFGTGLYGFATKPRMRVLAHSGDDPLRGRTGGSAQGIGHGPRMA